MPKQDIIVIGASAGGLEAILQIVKVLPADFPASIFIVIHLSPYSPSQLPKIINRAGSLPAIHPKDGDPIEPGTIYIAPPDHHMVLEKENKVLVRKGPKENRFRPCIDALFRSAALVFGPRVVGVVLSGLLDDGTSGMWSIHRNGGTTIVQDPDEAQFPQMIQNVLQYVEVDHVLPTPQIFGLLTRLAGDKAPVRPALTQNEMELLKMEVIIASQDNAFEMGILNKGELTTYSCPECKGALVRFAEGQMLRFRCHTGHAYSSSTLLAGITTQVEEKLWEAMQGLEATNMLLVQIGDHYRDAGNISSARMFEKKAKEIAKRARMLKEAAITQELMSEDLRQNDVSMNSKVKKEKRKRA
ncbi:MAG: chemotaxis protein CheB [Chitinophagaceae bacterium]|nr:MAG: chemotaxis protein CheB [Chitinophagaceae bacterium]